MTSRRDSWELAAGAPITEDLSVVERLGGGSTCEAYLAFDELTYGPAVVKMLRPAQVESGLAALREEVTALRTVNHPVVVRHLRHDLEGPRPHLVMEAVDGPRLSTLVRRFGPLPPEQYLPLAIELASAAHYLRRIGWVHLDLKPSNVVMAAPARVIDLSAARGVEAAAALTRAVGTDSWMAPEQCLPGERGTPGPASDVFGLGATMHHAIAGEPPFDEGDPDAREPADRWPQLRKAPRSLPAGVAAPIAEVVRAALSADPADRPAPAELAEVVEPVYAALPKGRLAGLRTR